MQIILVSGRSKAAKTLTIMPRHVAIAVAAFAALVLLASAGLSWLSLHWRLPVVQNLLLSVQRQENRQSDEVVSNNLKLMATRVGELQAQVLQLDTLGERLSSLAGLRKEAPVAKEKPARPGQGGPFIPAPLSAAVLQQEIDRLAKALDSRSDELAALEKRFLEKKVYERLLPTTLPVKSGAIGSGFGQREDPFLGGWAMHEGIDFVAEAGTPVVAAATGLVLVAERRPDFGNVVDIDHGDGLVSRYAHLSRITVKSGQIVRRGSEIGAVGSTGRSTGAHLHFEVRILGAPQNPAQFLKRGEEFAQFGKR